jgi:hypothetical protein
MPREAKSRASITQMRGGPVTPYLGISKIRCHKRGSGYIRCQFTVAATDEAIDWCMKGKGWSGNARGSEGYRYLGKVTPIKEPAFFIRLPQ